MLILASSSQNRQQALTLARIPFRAVPADIDERAIQHPDVSQRISMIAQAKVTKVAETEAGVILGADGVNVCEGRVLEKPLSLDEAREMLRFQSGKEAKFLTAYVILNTLTGKRHEGLTESSYKFRELSDAEIETYVTSEPVLQWSAAFSPLNSSAITFMEWLHGNPAQFCFSMPFDEVLPILRQELSSF